MGWYIHISVENKSTTATKSLMH
uniref:Uncharacterized protein n=1 Tax=Arundo donax TaxID=35708 RepID=A0A0A9FAX0_ARUDO